MRKQAKSRNPREHFIFAFPDRPIACESRASSVHGAEACALLEIFRVLGEAGASSSCGLLSEEATDFFRRYLPTLPSGPCYLLHPEKVEGGTNRYRYDMRRPFQEHVAAHGMKWRLGAQK
jgi:hypothetical protein